MIAAMTLGGVQASMSIDAATDTEVFVAFVEQVLVPTLRAGQVIVMDNLAVHKVSRVIELIERAKCRVLFLPPYSPDLSPIEPMWSKVKHLLRTAAARTINALELAIGLALSSVTASDCHGYFRHCGYSLGQN